MQAALLQQLRSAAERTFAEQAILAAYVFGSRVSGHPLPDSDLDIGYYLVGYARGECMPLEREMLLATLLSEAVGVEVDLRNLADAPLELRGRVLEEGVRIYSSDDVERVGLERDLLARYHDYKDVFLQMHELRLKRIAEKGL